MSKGSRTRSTIKRKAEKKRRKEQKKLLYQGYSEAGRKNNNKKNARKKTVSSIKGCHITTDCGNTGCKKCYPQYAEVPKNRVAA